MKEQRRQKNDLLAGGRSQVTDAKSQVTNPNYFLRPLRAFAPFAFSVRFDIEEYQLRSGFPVFNVCSMRACVFSVASKSMKHERSRSTSHCSSTRLPASTSP